MEFDDSMFENIGDKEDIPTNVIDDALLNVRELEQEYMEARKVSSEANGKYVEAKEKLISLLKAAGKDRWDSPDPNLSGFTISDQLKFRVPQGHENKADFFKFLKSETVSSLLGQSPEEIYLTYVSVNSKSLTPLCRKIKELAAEKGQDIEIPGLMSPTFETTLRSLPKKRSK